MTRARSQLRLAAEEWLHTSFYWLRHPFTPNHPQYKLYVADMWAVYQLHGDGIHGRDTFATDLLRSITFRVREPYGIVKSQTQNGRRREVGQPSSVSYQECLPRLLSEHTKILHRVHSLRYDQSEHGLVVRSLYLEQDRLARRERASLHLMEWTDPPQTTGEMAASLMTEPRDELGGRDLTTYAEEKGAVYIFACGSQSAYTLWREELRFLCDDPSNPVLMWNPNRVQFEDNICPYHQRHDHGLEQLDRADCQFLGIISFYLVDDQFPIWRSCCELEHSCQLEIDHLLLGKQRMHRVAGAGSRDFYEGSGRMVIGATVLPPLFFELHTNIVVVDSYNT